MDELTPVTLNTAALHELPVSVARPSYDRTKLTPGIVHIGLGNFHRAHQAWYLHRLMQLGQAKEWAILGAGVRPADARMRDKLLAQDCLTTLLELGASTTSAEVIGSMIDFVPVEPDNRSLITAMTQPSIRIVSMTVTEGGYFVDPVSGAFRRDDPDIRHDAANPHAPRTAFGAIVEALRHRRELGRGPVTILSCDNLQSNGAIARDAVVSLAHLSSSDLANWINETCSFPNSMVDCIVPATSEKEIRLARSLGVSDAAPVSHEDFRQWVVEDAFCAGRPNWEDVGVTFTHRVHAYETMKLRILNAGHQVLANAGELLSQATIADCVSHPLIAAMFRKVQREEITPYVSAVPGMSPRAYADLIETRFANPAIRDTTRRVAFDGSSRHPSFVLPILRDALQAGGSVAGLSLVEALWARMSAGRREDGSDIEPNDPRWDDLQGRAVRSKDQPDLWLEQRDIYGALGDEPVFAKAFADWLHLIWAEGVESALRQYCQ